MTPGGRKTAWVLLGGCAVVATMTVWFGVALVRAVGGLAVLSVCPGWALLRHTRIEDMLERTVLAVAVSLALITVVAALLMYAGWWSPGRAIAVLAVLTVCAGCVERAPHAPGERGGHDVTW